MLSPIHRAFIATAAAFMAVSCLALELESRSLLARCQETASVTECRLKLYGR